MTDRSLGRCRVCGGALATLLPLGQLQLTGYLTPAETARPVAPLDFAVCTDCQLVQLTETVPPELLFREYWYRSGTNEVMRKELGSIVAQALARVGPLTDHDIVIDIGANDGTLLAAYRTHNCPAARIAFEPAANLQAALAEHAELVTPHYFPGKFRPGMVVPTFARAKIITSIATFYAVDDPLAYVAAIRAALHPDGVWIVQLQDLAQMLEATAFDNICHEHLIYYSLASLHRLLVDSGLAIVAAERRAINGGSLRVTIQHEGQLVGHSVGELLALEAPHIDWMALERFAWRAQAMRRQIVEIVEATREQGETVDLYGASTKANTLLQFCELTGDHLRQAWERSPEKVGRRTAGSDIPIVSEDAGRADPPDALLVGIWQFRDAVVAREADYLLGGGALIFPLPAVDIVTANRQPRVRVS